MIPETSIAYGFFESEKVTAKWTRYFETDSSDRHNQVIEYTRQELLFENFDGFWSDKYADYEFKWTVYLICDQDPSQNFVFRPNKVKKEGYEVVFEAIDDAPYLFSYQTLVNGGKDAADDLGADGKAKAVTPTIKNHPANSPNAEEKIGIVDDQTYISDKAMVGVSFYNTGLSENDYI